MSDSMELVINILKTQLLAKIKPKTILIFGSVAKGNSNEDSDLDLLIVWDEYKNLPNIKRRIILRKAIGMVGHPVDIITCTSEELEKALQDKNSFTSNIVKEGEVIYGRLG